jgi:outer membrane protein OmpA-like peptidoglycan-associated protein
MFNLGSVSLERARVALNDGKYNDAAYNASDASIRFEIASLVAQARAARYERMKLLGDSCTAGIMTNPVMDAQFFKKGEVFRANIYDRQVFVIKKDHVYYTISSDGKEKLDKIVKVLNSYPNYKMKIVGHTSEPDYNDYSKQKADVVAKYFYGKNISSDRIEIMGMGNKEVLDTHLGFRRVDRVEFILSAPK